MPYFHAICTILAVPIDHNNPIFTYISFQPGQTFSPAGSVEGSPHHQPSMPGMAPPYMMPGTQPGVMPPYSQAGYTAPPGHYQPPYPGYQPPMPGQPMPPAPPATTQQGYGPPPGQEYSGYNVQGRQAGSHKIALSLYWEFMQ